VRLTVKPQACPVRRSGFLTILWQREKKGNGTFVLSSASMIADQSQPWLTNFHEILTKKGGKLPTTDNVSLHPHARAILTFWRARQNVREDLVKVREVRKRSTCYHR